MKLIASIVLNFSLLIKTAANSDPMTRPKNTRLPRVPSMTFEIPRSSLSWTEADGTAP